jgi:hypothetical protein
MWLLFVCPNDRRALGTPVWIRAYYHFMPSTQTISCTAIDLLLREKFFSIGVIRWAGDRSKVCSDTDLLILLIRCICSLYIRILLNSLLYLQTTVSIHSCLLTDRPQGISRILVLCWTNPMFINIMMCVCSDFERCMNAVTKFCVAIKTYLMSFLISASIGQTCCEIY